MCIEYCRLVPFWVGARGTEFDWVYIQMGFETNIRLVSLYEILNQSQ